jgi:choline kinase
MKKIESLCLKVLLAFGESRHSRHYQVRGDYAETVGKKFKALKNTFAGFFEISKNSFLVKKLYESFEKLSFKNLYTAFLKNFSATFQKLFFAKKVL